MACAGILAGTLLPRVEAVEELAEILLGRPVRRLPRRTWYRLAPTPLRMRDGSLRLAWKMVHPDPDAHAVLEAIQSEMTQAAARWRPLDAGARGGLIEIVLGPPHGDVPVDAVLPLEAVLAGRTVPDALAACGLLPESREDLARLLGEAGEAAEERLKKRMAREGLTPRDLLRPEVGLADLGDICLNRLFQADVPSNFEASPPDAPSSGCPGRLVARELEGLLHLGVVRYQRQGGRRSRAVVDRRRYPTPHAVIAARLNGRVEDPVEGFVYEPLPLTAALRRLLGRLASV